MTLPLRTSHCLSILFKLPPELLLRTLAIAESRDAPLGFTYLMRKHLYFHAVS